jgi:hypothetical protein
MWIDDKTMEKRMTVMVDVWELLTFVRDEYFLSALQVRCESWWGSIIRWSTLTLIFYYIGILNNVKGMWCRPSLEASPDWRIFP